MHRFYFHIRLRDTVEIDPDGTLFASLEDARADAQMAAREIVAERLEHGDVEDDDVFEITDDRGALVSIVPFRPGARLH